MRIIINGNRPKGKKANILIFVYNKISNMIYMINYNLILNIFNRPV